MLAHALEGERGQEVRELLARRPELQAVLEEMRATRSALNEFADEAEHAVAEARTETTHADREVVQGIAAHWVGGDSSRENRESLPRPDGASPSMKRRPRRMVFAWLTAAAAFLLIWSQLSTDSTPPLPDGWLAATGVVRPEGLACTSFELFEVDAMLEAGDVMTIVVLDGRGERELARASVEATTWRPDPSEREALETAGEIRWSYVIESPGRRITAQGGASARLAR